MTEQAFRKLFWGFLLIMVDIRLQGFDILPDVIGYILIAGGLSRLTAGNEAFTKARSVVLPLGILSLVSLYEAPLTSGINTHGWPWGVAGFFLSVVYLIVNLWMVYYIFEGIEILALNQNHQELAGEAQKRLKQYIVLQIAVMGAFPMMFIPGLGVLYLVGVLIFSVVLTVLVLKTMNRCAMELSD